jgi:hypothetical protein
VATAYNLFKIMGNVDVSTQSELLEAKVPMVFLVTAGFSSPRDGRYYLLLYHYNIVL